MKAVLSVAVFVTLAGCVISPEAGPSGSDPDLITREEVMGAGMTNLYEVVERLRPRWLNTIGTTLVYLDDVSMGGLDALREMPPTTAYDLQWLAPLQARQRIPSIGLEDDLGGVIFVRTRPDGDG